MVRRASVTVAVDMSLFYDERAEWFDRSRDYGCVIDESPAAGFTAF
jgi:hypothetical protein